jgi:O-antigen biosynthesis protein WbqV
LAGLNLRRLKRSRTGLAVLHDTVMAAISFIAALYLRLGVDFQDQTANFLIEGTLLFTAISAVTFVTMGLYRGIWRYASLNDMIAITKAVTIAVMLFTIAMFLITRLELMPRSTMVINWLLLLVLLGGPRFIYRLAKDGSLIGLADRGYDARIPVLLVGSGDRAEGFLRAMRGPGERYRVVGILGSSSGRVGRNIHGVPVLGEREDFAESVERLRRRGQRPHRLLLADERLDGTDVGALLKQAESFGMTLSRVPRPTDFADDEGPAGRGLAVETRPIALEDLLGRPQTLLDRGAMSAMVSGRRVLITGAGGTIGAELARQIGRLGPATLTILDSSEFNLYRIDQEIGMTMADLAYEAVLADIRDAAALESVFARARPELVFHAAALKHVPIAEAHVSEAVLTNVAGTRNVADVARRHGARAMVQISTDKAVNPTNVMGTTKRLAESYCQALDEVAGEDGTRYLTVRFGNVIGSTGSVVPLFQSQLAAGGPLTVTHPDMKRYFMTVREAVELVLEASAMGLEATSGTPPGGIFVLDMGEPVRIVDLARQMIRLAGLKPDQDIEIRFVGPRPGEKLFEELFHSREPLVATGHKGIQLARPRAGDVETVRHAINAIATLAENHDDGAVRQRLRALVPEYHAADDSPDDESPAAAAR